MRTSIASLCFSLFALGCPTPEPAPPKPVPQPVKAVAPPAPPVVEPPPVPPAPEVDPPGTLYTWEDGKGMLHVTQIAPPPGVRIISKEMPRDALTDSVEDIGEPKAPAAEIDTRAARYVTEIASMRASPVAYGANFAPTGTELEVQRALKNGRRRYADLARDDGLDAQAKRYFNLDDGVHVLGTNAIFVSRRSPRQALRDWLFDSNGRKALLTSQNTAIGAACGPDSCVVVLGR